MRKAYLRKSFIDDLPSPVRQSGALSWLKENLFSSWQNTILTLVALFLLYVTALPAFYFLIFDAVWAGADRASCLAPESGACWAFIKAKLGQFIYGRYPLELRWRVDLVFFSGASALLLLVIPALPGKRTLILFLLLIFPPLSFILLTGGLFGLSPVETSLWGGLLVTLVVSITGIAASFPLGILLALGRRSEMAAVHWVSLVFIEFWRGIPLIIVLFLASNLLPLFLPEGVSLDKLLRALICVALFTAAYTAEVVRGGLQAIPRGQYEAAHALGLGYWQTTGFIILPQALKHVIPGLVNSFIALFKDTTLVSIIGMFDLLGIVHLSLTDPNWSTPTTGLTGYAFVALVFWIFCFAMSHYSLIMERRLDRDHPTSGR